jgi:hypothetical protein
MSGFSIAVIFQPMSKLLPLSCCPTCLDQKSGAFNSGCLSGLLCKAGGINLVTCAGPAGMLPFTNEIFGTMRIINFRKYRTVWSNDLSSILVDLIETVAVRYSLY